MTSLTPDQASFDHLVAFWWSCRFRQNHSIPCCEGQIVICVRSLDGFPAVYTSTKNRRHAFAVQYGNRGVDVRRLMGRVEGQFLLEPADCCKRSFKVGKRFSTGNGASRCHGFSLCTNRWTSHRRLERWSAGCGTRFLCFADTILGAVLHSICRLFPPPWPVFSRPVVSSDERVALARKGKCWESF